MLFRSRLFSCRVPRCKHLLEHTVSYEVSRFSTSEAVIISAIIVLSWVCLFLLFLKKLLDSRSKDFQLSCHFLFGVVASFWLGHHEPCFILFGCIYYCLQCCWCCCIYHQCHCWIESCQKLSHYISNGCPFVCVSLSL